MTSFTDKKSPTTEDASLNITDEVSTGSKDTDVLEQVLPRKRKVRVATQDALRSIGKIAKLERSRSKKDDLESYRYIHSNENNDINNSQSVDTSNLKIPTLPNNTDDIYTGIFDTNDSMSFVSEASPLLNDDLSTKSLSSRKDDMNDSCTLKRSTTNHENVNVDDVNDIIKLFDVPRTIRYSIASKNREALNQT